MELLKGVLMGMLWPYMQTRLERPAGVFFPCRPFQPSLMFGGKARSLPRVELLRGVLLGCALALPAN